MQVRNAVPVKLGIMVNQAIIPYGSKQLNGKGRQPDIKGMIETAIARIYVSAQNRNTGKPPSTTSIT